VSEERRHSVSVRKAPLESIQPRGKDLPDPEEVVSRLEKLEVSGNALVGYAGWSFEGRPIPYAVLSSPANLERVESIRKRFQRASTPSVLHRTLRDIDVVRHKSSLETIPLPILFTGGSFAFEASLTEALLRVAERLAAAKDELTKEVLRSLVVLVVPMTNPDGTVRANGEWSSTPTSCGWEGSGNSFGLLQNRDFVCLSQPETQAIARLWQDWCPLMHYDPQEDIVMLGVTRDELCWCPPYRAGTFPSALSPIIRQWVDHLGQVIAGAWREQGERLLYDPTGEEGFLPMVGELGARCAVGAVFHDVIGIETESARTPGTQTWEDRNRQKVTAAMALLEAAIRERAVLLEQLLDVRNRVDTGSSEAYLIPQGQRDRGMLAAALATLRMHGVQVYSVVSPTKAFVVPLSQPRPYLIRFLLSDWPGVPHACLAPEYGIEISRLSDLPQARQAQFLDAQLFPYEDHVNSGISVVPGRGSSGTNSVFAFPPKAENTRLIMRLLRRAPECRVSYIESQNTSGVTDGHLVEGVTEEEIRKVAGGRGFTRLAVDAYLVQGEQSGKRTPLVQPHVAVYAGLGCTLDYSEYSGAIRYGLEYLEIPYEVVSAADVSAIGALDRYDVLIVPNGDARQIVGGAAAASTYSSLPPWSPPAQMEGIGDRGLEAIRQFVARGGRYIGFELGGGALAGRRYLGLADVDIADSQALSPGPACLVVRDAPNPLFRGLCCAPRTADCDVSVWTYLNSIPSWYFAPGEIAGGRAPVVSVGSGARVLADVGDNRHPAIVIVDGKSGAGDVLVFSIAVFFRGMWRSSAMLLANAVLTPKGHFAERTDAKGDQVAQLSRRGGDGPGKRQPGRQT